MENKTINIAVVAEVAAALKPIKEEIVFVGGAVISLYTDDPAADEIRPTQDVDMTINIVNLRRWVELQEELASLGFYPDPNGHAICSYKYNNIPVDIMSIEDGSMGPSNRWYKVGLDDLWSVNAKDQEVKILSAPCFLATKFEAFNGRGVDYRTSHDIEDIVYVLDNRTSIVEEIEMAKESVKSFLVEELEKLVTKGLLEEVLNSHIHPLIIQYRLPLVQEKIGKILEKKL